MPHTKLIGVARGFAPVDLLIRNCRLINVLSGEIHEEHIAIADGLVVGFGEYEARAVLNAEGRFACPGLIEGHIHIESTLLHPVEFAKVAAVHGTAAVICDPHEIANVLGIPGIEWMLDVTRDLPLEIFFMMPSCVPATHLENAGAVLSAADIRGMLAKYPDRILGLAEMMNFPGVLFEDPGVLAKIAAAGIRPVDGHAPGLTGKDLSAYILAGPGSDHEACHLEEAREKLRKGVHVMIREGSSEKNLHDLLPLVTDRNSQNCSLVTDDRHCDDLVREGHLDHTLRLAMAAGLDPVRAIQMASINTARYFGLRRRGAIAPGYRADIVLLDDLTSFAIDRVLLAGRPLDVASWTPGSSVHQVRSSVHLRQTDATQLVLAAPEVSVQAKVIATIPGQIVTAQELHIPKIEEGRIVADPLRDLAKLAVFERHHATGNVGLGLVKGLGLTRGAIASTVGHDSHNLVVAGVSDADMLLAVQTLVQCGGGFVCVADNRVLALLPLPLAGLMSDEPAESVVRQLDDLNAAARSVGCPEHINPFMQLSFLSLPVIPKLRLTDMGLVDVEAFDFVPLT